MLKKLFQQNPLLKLLLPVLFICALGFLFILFLKPQLAYREELRAEVTRLNNELNSIRKLATQISATDKQGMEEQLRGMQTQLGLGLYSPELVQLIEESAKQTRIKIHNYSFAEMVSKDGFQERKLTLLVQGNYQSIVEFQKNLDAVPPFQGLDAITIKPLADSENLEAELTLSFSAVPLAYEKADTSSLIMREHPFR